MSLCLEINFLFCYKVSANTEHLPIVVVSICGLDFGGGVVEEMAQVLQENLQREEMEECKQRCTQAGHNMLLSLGEGFYRGGRWVTILWKRLFYQISRWVFKFCLTCTLAFPSLLGLKDSD